MEWRLSPDQSREINHLAAGRGFGEGQVPRPGSAHGHSASVDSVMADPAMDLTCLAITMDGTPGERHLSPTELPKVGPSPLAPRATRREP